MPYRIKSTALLGTGDHEEYQNLNKKEALQKGNILLANAQIKGWEVGGQFSTVPEVVEIWRDDAAYTVAILEQ